MRIKEAVKELLKTDKEIEEEHKEEERVNTITPWIAGPKIKIFNLTANREEEVESSIHDGKMYVEQSMCVTWYNLKKKRWEMETPSLHIVGSKEHKKYLNLQKEIKKNKKYHAGYLKLDWGKVKP